MKRILLAVDGSESSKKAARKTAELAGPLGAEVTILTVVKETSKKELPLSDTDHVRYDVEKILEEYQQGLTRKGQRILEEVSEYFKDTDIKIKKVIKQHGRIAHTICNYSESKKFDMIVVADKGLGGVKRFLLGSISDKVIRHADTSVLVVK